MQERAERAQDQDLIAAFRAGLHSWTGRPDCSPEDLGQALATLRAPPLLGSLCQDARPACVQRHVCVSQLQDHKAREVLPAGLLSLSSTTCVQHSRCHTSTQTGFPEQACQCTLAHAHSRGCCAGKQEQQVHSLRAQITGLGSQAETLQQQLSSAEEAQQKEHQAALEAQVSITAG